MTVVPLSAHERLSAAFARYDALWVTGGDELPAARLELCRALVECGDQLEPALLAQMDLDRATVESRQVIEV
jgi:hypothetical protein